MDANSAYCKVDIEEEDNNKAAFKSYHGLFGFIRMPFGLKSAPGSFQGIIDIIVYQAKWKHALVNLEDAIYFLKSVKKHVDHVETVLRFLNNAGVTIKIKVFTIHKPRILPRPEDQTEKIGSR